MSVEQSTGESADSTDSQTAPLEDPKLLEALYWEEELSQRDLADRFDCAQSTVHRVLKKHNISTRLSSDQKTQPCCWVNEEGYAYADSNTDGENDRVGVHELTAIAAGVDPHYVFDDNTHTHHRIHHKIDIPENVEVMNASDHQRLHSESDHTEPPVNLILDRAPDV